MQHKKRSKTSLPFDLSDSIKKGTKLAGDDYSNSQIEKWFKEEQEAYYEMDAEHDLASDPWYEYMRFVNEKLGFKYVNQNKQTGAMLVLGPGPGVEVELFHKINPNWRLFFLEASDNYMSILKEKFDNSTIVLPTIQGDILLEDNSQDAVVAFSVLHHIPNVSKLISESFRVLKDDGILLIREPCSSMGDWRYVRSATPNERGISKKLVIDMAEKLGFRLLKSPTPIIFEPINTILKKTIGFRYIPVRLIYYIDSLISRIVSANDYYWRDKWYKKVGPSSFFYVFKK